MRFVDIDLAVDAKKVGKGNGADMRRPAFCKYAKYADTTEIIPESRWREEYEKAKESSASKLVTRIYDQKNEGSCFPPGTLVTMASGEVRQIEQVNCLESVITAENNVGQVRQTMA